MTQPSGHVIQTLPPLRPNVTRSPHDHLDIQYNGLNITHKDRLEIQTHNLLPVKLTNVTSEQTIVNFHHCSGTSPDHSQLCGIIQTGGGLRSVSIWGKSWSNFLIQMTESFSLCNRLFGAVYYWVYVVTESKRRSFVLFEGKELNWHLPFRPRSLSWILGELEFCHLSSVCLIMLKSDM